MLQIGIALFVFSALEGFAIPSLPVLRLGLSVHTPSALQGVMLLGLGLSWPRLNLGATASRIAFWTHIYSSFATLVPYVMAAVWGAGNTTIPLAAGAAQGSALQEAIIKVVLYSAALPFFISMALGVGAAGFSEGMLCAVPATTPDQRRGAQPRTGGIESLDIQ